MHEVLVNRLGGLSLPGKSVVRLTDHPDMTLDVHGCNTTMQILWTLVQSYTVSDLILFGGHCDLYIMVQRFCLVSLTISNRKTSYRSLKQTAGSTSCPF